MLLVLWASLLSPGAPDGERGAGPAKVFLDTDVCVDAGDLAALAMMHGLARAGEIEILGVTCVTSNPHAAGCVDAVNGWYGRPEIPVGTLKDTGFLDKSDYSEAIARAWPNRHRDGSAAVPDATALFRQVVAAQPDRSVVLVSIGPLRNLRKFLESPADAHSPLSGRDLIARKVRELSCMACVFKPVNPWGKGNLKSEWNIEQDVPSAKYVFANWPTRVMVSGFEIGWPVHADQGLVDAFTASPVAYGLKRQGGGRPAWDQTSLLYAARGLGGIWEAEGPGRCEIRDDGSNPWTGAADGKHFHLKAKMEARELARLIDSVQLEAEQGRAVVEFKPDVHVLSGPLSLTLSLPPALSGHRIRYTLDGSIPDRRAPEGRGPILLKEAAVVRAAIFDGKDERVSVVTREFSKGIPLAPVEVPGAKKGLKFRVFEGSWTELPDLDREKEVRTGTAAELKTPLPANREHYAVRFTGFVEIPKDGVYTFRAKADDGIALTLGGGKLSLRKPHTAQAGTAGSVALGAGKHALQVDFINNTGSGWLEVSLEGPETGSAPIPAGRLFSAD